MNLLTILKREKENNIREGIYQKLQVEMTYNSNRIEGNELSLDQVYKLYETKSLDDKDILIDDIIEITNHFRCIDLAIESSKIKLTESLIKQFHYVLKTGISNSNYSWIKIGDYKLVENEVGGIETSKPSEVKNKIKELLNWYNSLVEITIEDIIEFHFRFETIHPFQDGNGRVGRLIMLKECLKHNFIPILITDEYKSFYYRGLKEWNNDNRYLIDTCLFGQDIFKEYMNYFKIKY